MMRARALGAALAALLALGVAVAVGGARVDAWIAATDLPPLVPETSVEVLAEDGTLLRAYTVADGRWRMAMDSARADPGYLAMLIAYEDRRFWRHGGVDLRAMVRAATQALAAGRVVSGGSTLTMQVARLLEDGPTGQWQGKLRQIRVALALERALSKPEILALYLHYAPFGGNLEGLRAASFAWAGKEPARLTPAEAALMVALPQAPEARRPDRHPARARAARDRVLARMVRAGVIDADTAAAARRAPVPSQRQGFPQLAPHLADRLRAADPDRRIHRTTLDARLQAALERLARDAVAGEGGQLSVAMVVADHDTGAIRAQVGSALYTDAAREGFVDMTQALRSPGSALKPLVYGLGFADGRLHPESVMLDRPASFGGYAPRNFDGMFRGAVTAREALQLSLNLPVVELTAALGPARLTAALRRAGLHAVIPGDAPGLAVALGGLGISLQDMVQLYAAIARGGEVVQLRTAAAEPDAVEPDATRARGDSRARLMPPDAAWHLGEILARAPRPGWLPDGPLAFKTGTSYGHRDALALGFDGAHVAGVWVGRADGAPVPGMYGVDVAAPLLFEAFARIAPEMAPLPPPPTGVLAMPTARLPGPLRAFGAARTVAGGGAGPSDAPVLAFPPDGAAVAALDGRIKVQVTQGTAPFTWLADGAPVLTASHEREALLALPGPGFVALSVIDATGRAARAQIELR